MVGIGQSGSDRTTKEDNRYADSDAAAAEGAEKLYAAVGSKKKTLKIFNADEGGAEHCHVDNRQVGIDYVADWITEVLK